MILGVCGPQRSGKTAVAMYIARYFQDLLGSGIYSNVEGDNLNLINKISDIPVDFKTKTLLFDEIYFYLDSRTFKDNKDFSLFLNTLGKQRILMIYTTISPDMVEKRVRDQTKYFFMVKSDSNYMYYMIYNPTTRRNSSVLALPKNKTLFKKLSYNSDLVVPNYVECDIKEFIKKVKEN